jgi:hypothetical protein
MGTMPTDYFTEEQLDKRIRDARNDLTYVQQKILILLVASTTVLIGASWIVLGYLTRYFEVRQFSRFDVLILAWGVNAAAWCAWTLLRFRKVVFPSSRFPMPDTDSLDEYRGLTYERARTRYFDRIFDTMAGIQFLLIVLRFVQLFIFGSR